MNHNRLFAHKCSPHPNPVGVHVIARGKAAGRLGCDPQRTGLGKSLQEEGLLAIPALGVYSRLLFGEWRKVESLPACVDPRGG